MSDYVCSGGLVWFSAAGPGSPPGVERSDRTDLVGDLLAARGDAIPEVTLIGAGENFDCYGAGERAVLVGGSSGSGAADRLRVSKTCSDAARGEGVRTPAFLEVGSSPVGYAICERVEGRQVGDDPGDRAKLYEALGDQLRRLHRAPVAGGGPVRPDSDQVRGWADSWRDHCESFAVGLLSDDPVEPAARLRRFGSLKAHHWRLFFELVLDHARRPTVLCHYDNRDPNLPVTSDGLAILDWDLARVAPLSHELIKPEVDRAALLDGYGLPPQDRASLLDDADVALMMDGVAMSLEWLDDPGSHGGVRGWLTTIEVTLERFASRRTV